MSQCLQQLAKHRTHIIVFILIMQIIFFTQAAGSAAAQSPGGVADDLGLWLRADAGTSTSTDGQAVSAWGDQSPNLHSATQVITMSQPAYMNRPAKEINFHPVIHFDGVNDTLGITGGVISGAPKSGVTAFLIHQYDSSVETKIFETVFAEPLFDLDSGLGVYFHRTGVACESYQIPADYYALCTPTATVAPNRPELWSFRFVSDSTREIFLHGVSVASDSSPPFSSTLAGFGLDFVISVQTFSDYYAGDIAELIVYNTDLTPAQRRQVESYLALKYGFTLGDASAPISYTSSSGAVIWDGLRDGQNFHANVTGIGRDDAAGLDQRQAKSSNAGDLVTMGQVDIAADNLSHSWGFLQDQSFLIWGHDQNSISFGVPVSGLTGAADRMARLWRVQETGDVRGVQVAISRTIGFPQESKLLIVSDDSTIGAGDAIYSLIDDGSAYLFTHVNFVDGQYFTFASGAADADGDGIPTTVECQNQTPCPDADGDGVPNYLDADSDNDGVPDAIEAGLDPTQPANSDGYIVPDYLDLDSDNDGINDVLEAGGVDANGDGLLDVTVDANGNGLDDSVEPSQGGTPLSDYNSDGQGGPDRMSPDSDGDGLGDYHEDDRAEGDDTTEDYDEDGILFHHDGHDATWGDVDDATRLLDADQDGLPNYRDLDSDNDGVPDQIECVRLWTYALEVAWSRWRDVDRDGTPDCYDLESDGDGVNDVTEAGGVDANNDGLADGVDSDNNGIIDAPLPLPDADGDGVLNGQDLDDDGDGIPDPVEGTDDLDNDSLPNHLDLDSDGDGVSDVLEAGGLDADGDGRQDPFGDGSDDTNRNGLVDSVDAKDDEYVFIISEEEPPVGAPLPLPDSDGDTEPDYLDADDDDDGVPSKNEDINGDGDLANDNTDGDTLPNYLDADDDGDGIPSKNEDINGDGDLTNDNTDGDVLPNYLDADDDGDGILTRDEDANGDGDPTNDDSDSDGIPDYLDSVDDGVILTLFVDSYRTICSGAFFQFPCLRAREGADEAWFKMYEPITDFNYEPGYLYELRVRKKFVAIPDCQDDCPTYEWTWLEEISKTLSLSPDGDNDFDGVGDILEERNANGNPYDDDSDGDSAPDFLDTDDDGDGVLTGIDPFGGPTLATSEDVNSNGDRTDDDSDDDDSPNYLDADDDGDGIPTKNEDRNGDGDLANDNTDGDDAPNYLDADDDGDGILTEDEDANDNGDPTDDDSDGDGIPDYLDLDSDGDGIADAIEALPPSNMHLPDAVNSAGVQNVAANDTDGDGAPDYLDLDSDNDSLNDVLETGGGDLDGDGLADGVDANQDGIVDNAATNPSDTDGDGQADYRDLDSDNNGVYDIVATENSAFDSNGDGMVDGADMDHDGIIDAVDGNLDGRGDAPLVLLVATNLYLPLVSSD